MSNGKRLNVIEKLAYRILRLTDIENITLRAAVKQFAASVPAGARVLDAGAGLKPYEGFFQHCAYESCDFAHCDEFYGNIDDGRRANIAGRHTYVCPLEKIPVADNTFDFVLCTQVLEHVPDPLAAVREAHRVLKPSGQLLLTVPQGYGVHGEPFNYFNFTRYGLDLILKQAGFEVMHIKERGGYFYCLFDRIANAMPRIAIDYRRRTLVIMALSPLHILLAYLIAPPLLLLEPLDKKKRFTMGYVALARKAH